MGRDLEEGLCTIPLIYALKADEAGIRELLGKLRLSDLSTDKAVLASILARCAETGGIEAARQEAARYTARAQAEIARLPACPARDELSSVADKLLNRAY